MPFLDDSIRTAQEAVEQRFLFRKIGLPYDYASSPEEFPSKAFATAREARANLPNPTGLGGGYEASCRNHSLLFDAYLLRVEYGIETQSDEAILDRLIGGLIRLDTVAPKSFLVSGLSSDGRGFYAHTIRDNQAAWAFAMMRGLSTAAIAPESQEKFRSIAGKWLERLRRDKFKLHSVDNKPLAGCDISRLDSDNGPFMLAFNLVGAKAAGQDADYDAYSALADENGRLRLARPAAVANGDGNAVPAAFSYQTLWRQMALSIIAENDPEPERRELAKERMRELAILALPRCSDWRNWDQSLFDQPVDLDWRKQARVSLDKSPYGFVPHESWARLEKEQPLADALAAIYTVLLAGDRELAEPHAQDMEECLATARWQDVVGLHALAPAIGAHVRGVELELWDKTLYDSRREAPSSEMSFAAKFLEPDYDEKNPVKAGHRSTPPGKRRPEAQGGKGDPARRRRRKKRR